jgi:hypothetical protein
MTKYDFPLSLPHFHELYSKFGTLLNFQRKKLSSFVPSKVVKLQILIAISRFYLIWESLVFYGAYDAIKMVI